MRLSPTTGKALLGQGSGVISIDGLVPASLAAADGGGWDWLDDDTCGGQAEGIVAGGFRLYQLIVSTDTLSILDPVYNGGVDVAQQFRAGNGEWARFIAGGGVHTSAGLGLTLPLAALGDMDADGRLAVVQNYTADNGIVAYAANGSTLWTNATTVLAGTQRLRAKDDIVAYQDTQQRWHLRDMATGNLAAFAPRTDATVATIVPVKINGTVYVVELTTTDLTLRPATASSGYVLATSGSLFFPDAVSMAANTVRVGWSVTAGEARTSLRLADVNITDGAFTSGSSVGGGGVVLTPESPLPPDTFPVGPVQGGSSGLARKQPRHAIKGEAFVGGEDGKRVYQRWWEQVAEATATAPNLSQATGTVQPDQGGTGTTTGLAVINGQNVIADTTPLHTAQSFGPFVLADGRNMVLAGPLTINQYLQLDGSAQLVVV